MYMHLRKIILVISMFITMFFATTSVSSAQIIKTTQWNHHIQWVQNTEISAEKALITVKTAHKTYASLYLKGEATGEYKTVKSTKTGPVELHTFELEWPFEARTHYVVRTMNPLGVRSELSAYFDIEDEPQEEYLIKAFDTFDPEGYKLLNIRIKGDVSKLGKDAWVGIYEVWAPSRNYRGKWKFLRNIPIMPWKKYDLRFAELEDETDYEVRLFSERSVKSLITTSNVINFEKRSKTMLHQKQLKVWGTATVSIDASDPDMWPTGNNSWVGLYKLDASDKDYLKNWKYFNRKSDDVEIKNYKMADQISTVKMIIDTAGTYEARLFRTNSIGSKIKSFWEMIVK